MLFDYLYIIIEARKVKHNENTTMMDEVGNNIFANILASTTETENSRAFMVIENAEAEHTTSAARAMDNFAMLEILLCSLSWCGCVGRDDAVDGLIELMGYGDGEW